MRCRTSTIATVLLALAALPLPVKADPIGLTGGAAQVSVNIASARITFAGDGFFFRTGTEDFFAGIRDWPFPLTTPVNLGGE